MPTAGVSRYKEQQMQAHSWWPKEQPGQARHEYNLMKGNAENLNVWCGRWLDAGQQKQLQKFLVGRLTV